MTGYELAQKLLKLDPNNEVPVSVGNYPIIDVTLEPHYYDGILQQFETDSNGRVIKGTYATSGDKLVVEYRSIEDEIWNNPEFPISYPDTKAAEYYKARHDEIRRQSLEIDYTVDCDTFCDWVFTKIQKQHIVPLTWVERIRTAAKTFYEKEKLCPNTPLVKTSYTASYHESHIKCLEENFSVQWDKYSRINIERKSSETPPKV